MKSLYGGKLQQRIDSFNTVADHLDTLEQLVKAFDGGDETTLANIKSAYQREFGQPAPSNKDTAAALVSSEVLKAIEGSSGGVTDREEAKKYLGQNNTAGALGAIGVARKLVGGQLNATRKRVVDADKLISGDEFEDQLTSAARKALEQAGPEPDAPASGGYTIGQKQGGYTYIGGDPTDQKSWQKDN
jgi:hypothetical protein